MDSRIIFAVIVAISGYIAAFIVNLVWAKEAYQINNEWHNYCAKLVERHSEEIKKILEERHD